MKVLQVINSLGTGGAEKLIIDSLPVYMEKGLEIELLLLNSRATPFLKQLISSSNCKIHSIGEGSVYNPKNILKIIPFLKKFDVVHVHLFPSLYWVAIAKILSRSRAKFIFTEHNTSNKRRNLWIFKFFDRIIYSVYDKIVTIAEEVDNNLRRHLKGNTSKFELIENGIDLKSYKNAIPLSKTEFFENDDIILIQVSSFRIQKDQPTLIRALKLLPEQFKLLLVGEGHLKAENKNLVEYLDLSSRVKFCGIREDVPSLLKTADFVILSSHHEGLSLSSIEGMASGKPFLASDVPGLTEVVKGAGVLFPEGDEKSLAKEILKLINTPEYYKKIAANGLKRSQKYDLKVMVDRYIVLYHRILDSSPQ
ncbi:glycosyltransferase [Salegentibacter sp. HM20]